MKAKNMKKRQISKKSILTILQESGFMLGVNKGFHESPLPKFAIKNYSDLKTLKDKKHDLPIAQDLGLRIGTQILAKGTVGGAAYAGLRNLEQHVADNSSADSFLNSENVDDDQAKLAASVPAIALAWAASDKLQNYLPEIHKKLFNEKSIYK